MSKYTLQKQRLEITHPEKVLFIKVSELKLTQVEFFSFLYLIRAADKASELFCMDHLANNERFLYHSNLSF